MAYDYSPAAADALLAALTARMSGDFAYFELPGDGRRRVDVADAFPHQAGLTRVALAPQQAAMLHPDLDLGGPSLTLGWSCIYQRPDLVTFLPAGQGPNNGKREMRTRFGRRPYQLYACCAPGLRDLARAVVLYAARDYFDLYETRPVLNFSL